MGWILIKFFRATERAKVYPELAPEKLFNFTSKTFATGRVAVTGAIPFLY